MYQKNTLILKRCQNMPDGSKLSQDDFHIRYGNEFRFHRYIAQI